MSLVNLGRCICFYFRHQISPKFNYFSFLWFSFSPFTHDNMGLAVFTNKNPQFLLLQNIYLMYVCSQVLKKEVGNSQNPCICEVILIGRDKEKQNYKHQKCSSVVNFDENYYIGRSDLFTRFCPLGTRCFPQMLHRYRNNI